jgi:hypothetical protein
MSQRNIDDDLELDALYAKLERYEAVIEAARRAPYELKSILESLSFAAPENLPLHYARLAELGNELYEVVSALEAAEKNDA